jgi:hypothetical protein
MVVCASLVGCATTASITPKLSQNPAACKLHATIRYDGKADYLPAALINDESAHGAMAFRYSFEAQYGLHEYNAFLVAVNPLSLVGFPTGNDNLVVVGRVDLMRGETVVRTYAAVASLKRTPSIFGEGETFTDMRHHALMLVKDNLSAQLCQDQGTITKLLEESSSG